MDENHLIFPFWCLYCTKLEPISKTNDVARSARVVALDQNCTLGLRGEANWRASSAPCGRGTKPKIFLPFLDFRRGVWGEPTKNGKEIFGFGSATSLLQK